MQRGECLLQTFRDSKLFTLCLDGNSKTSCENCLLRLTLKTLPAWEYHEQPWVLREL